MGDAGAYPDVNLPSKVGASVEKTSRIDERLVTQT